MDIVHRALETSELRLVLAIGTYLPIANIIRCVPVTLTIRGAPHPPLLPVEAIPAPVQGYSAAFARGIAHP